MKLPQALNKKEQKREYDKKYHLKNKEQKREYDKKYYLKNKEHRKKYQDQWYLNNKEQRKEYILKNKERRKEQRKEYILTNKEHVLRVKRRSYLKNKEQIIKKQSKYNKYKYQTDINFRLRVICRSRVVNALKGKFKSAKTMKLIGCTIKELRRYIESKFEPWMTWENHGKEGWDVDHIKACAKFDLTYPEQQRECFHWSNLQPLEHIANIKKGAR